MRVLLITVLCLFTTGALTAQTYDVPGGTYRRYRHLRCGEHSYQVLKLSGKGTGTYTLTEEGGEVPDVTTGWWKESRIPRRRYDSLHVVILDPENEHNARYFAIEPTGCLTPVYSDGYKVNRCNSFSPVRNGWSRK